MKVRNPRREKCDQLEKSSSYEMRGELRDLMWHSVGVERSAKGLYSTLKQILSLRERMEGILKEGMRGVGSSWIWRFKSDLETRNLLLVGETVTRAALDRGESVGAHYRVN
ncbi:MAG: hypothetical protein KAV87_15200 [Desulfobacteraceae bacterium]|nr:hypothetical protein [Desulfobacteraceae bacterium]